MKRHLVHLTVPSVRALPLTLPVVGQRLGPTVTAEPHRVTPSPSGGIIHFGLEAVDPAASIAELFPGRLGLQYPIVVVHMRISVQEFSVPTSRHVDVRLEVADAGVHREDLLAGTGRVGIPGSLLA